jgi:hypothetical protein
MTSAFGTGGPPAGTASGNVRLERPTMGHVVTLCSWLALGDHDGVLRLTRLRMTAP